MNDNGRLSYRKSTQNLNTMLKIHNEYLFILITFIYGFVILFGIFGNIIIIIIFTKQLKYKLSKQYQFFLNFQAWTDFLTCSISIPLIYHRDVQNRFLPVTDPNICWLILTLQYFPPWISTNILLFISFDQFFSVVKPYMKIKKRTWTIALSTYILIIITCSILYSKEIQALPEKYFCYPYGQSTLTGRILLQISSGFTLIVIILSISLYIIMFYKLRKRKNLIRNIENIKIISIQSSLKIYNKKLEKNNINLIRNMMICFYLVLIYIISTLPIIISLTRLIEMNGSLLYHILFLNNIINFIIYIIKLKSFRKDVKNLLKFKYF